MNNSNNSNNKTFFNFNSSEDVLSDKSELWKEKPNFGELVEDKHAEYDDYSLKNIRLMYLQWINSGQNFCIIPVGISIKGRVGRNDDVPKYLHDTVQNEVSWARENRGISTALIYTESANGPVTDYQCYLFVSEDALKFRKHQLSGVPILRESFDVFDVGVASTKNHFGNAVEVSADLDFNRGAIYHSFIVNDVDKQAEYHFQKISCLAKNQHSSYMPNSSASCTMVCGFN